MLHSSPSPESSAKDITRYGVVLALLWSLLITYSLYWEYRQHHEEALLIGRMQGKAFFEKDILFRRWGARHGGVYAPVSETTPPNPHLSHLPERDITTPSGRTLTLINPAYMTRQLYEMAQENQSTGRGHITSLNPIRTENLPDPWERQALESFEKGEKEHGEIVQIDGKPFYRYMKAMITEKPCLRCHASQGYREGQVRGGISVSVPLEPVYDMTGRELRGTYANHGIIWLLGMGTIAFGTRRLGRMTSALREKALELEHEVEERQVAQEALQDQTVVLEEEIAERQRVEDAVRSSEEKFAKAFENAPVMLSVSLEQEGTFLEVNRKFQQVSGFRREEIVGKSSVELGWLTGEQRQQLVDAVVKNGSVVDLPLSPRAKDGRRLSCLFSGEQIVIGGRKCVLIQAHDVTDQKAMEEQLRQSQKMEALGLLAGGVAHDFNNILTVIMGYGNLLEMEAGINDHQRKAVEQIVASSEKAAQLTRGLLAFSRKESMNLKVCDLNDVVIHVQKFLARVIGEDIQLKTSCSGAELPVMADGAQIEQVLINLATNARDAMPKGGVLTVETGVQTIDTTFVHTNGFGIPGSYAGITVADNGLGMDQETCSRIFEPFFTTKESGKGTGLGMSIVYGIIKQHHGFINVSSEPGCGTTFRIYLPLCTPFSDSSEAAAGTAVRVIGGDETILLVEDNDSVRELISSVLSGYGYKVVTAVDGQDGVEQFAAGQDEISLVLTDVIMPRLNGHEVVREVRRMKPDIRVLYLSGYTADVIQRSGAIDEGVELLLKPVQPMELLRKVRGLLDAPPAGS